MTGRKKTFEKGLAKTMYRKNKFNANMDSKHRSEAERVRAAQLKLLERAGKIQSLSEQVKFELLPPQDGEDGAFYVADFTYWQDGKFIVEDVKGLQRGDSYRLFVLKRKLMLILLVMMIHIY